jgi:hypothetical protein
MTSIATIASAIPAMVIIVIALGKTIHRMLTAVPQHSNSRSYDRHQCRYHRTHCRKESRIAVVWLDGPGVYTHAPVPAAYRPLWRYGWWATDGAV